MKFIINVFILLVISAPSVFAQNGILKGLVLNEINNQPVEYATVGLEGTSMGGVTNEEGYFEITSIEPGLYNIQISCIGYKTKTEFEIQISNAIPKEISIYLEKITSDLNEVTVNGNANITQDQTSISLHSIGVNEIQRNPGGNKDISKVFQSLPGVNIGVSFRNDLIIRGGAPNENRFFLDGIEVPNINHFATQGSSGGPVGLINTDLIRQVDFYTGGFHADRGNALSSVIEFVQKNGRTDHWGLTATLGSSDVGITMEGPTGKESSFIFSARRSYLQFLFKALGLPFLPTYNDYQFKEKIKFNQKNELSIISLGALDQFQLNLTADSTDFQKYILGNIPSNTQWNYTIGGVFKHFSENNYTTVVLSRNMLNNEAVKYFNNDDSQESNLIQNYTSQEIENKFRLENNYYKNNLKLNGGLGFEQAKYNTNTYNKVSNQNGQTVLISYNSELSFYKYFLFAEADITTLSDRLNISGGLRFDGNTYSSDMNNLLEQFSPRITAAYNFNSHFSFTANAGSYYQLPPYTALGFRDSSGNLINKQNEIKYMNCKHAVAGFQYLNNINSQITLEGFIKWYSQYPVDLRNNISLANLGSDFGIIGNTPVSSNGVGKSYGIELLLQQKLYKGFYGIASGTIFKSEFENSNQQLTPSSWDTRYIVSLTAGKKLKRNFEIGARWRLTGGAPYTPIDTVVSSYITVWDVTHQGLPDYSKINTERLGVFHQLDMRIDKKWFMKKINFNLFVDVQNVYAFKYTGAPYLDVIRDQNGNPVVNPANPSAYLTHLIYNNSGTVLPSIGIVLEL